MPTCFVIGQIFILIASKEVEKSKKFWTPPLVLALLYGIFIFAPVTGWYFYAHTGWSTVYLRAEDQVPVWAGPVILSLYVLGMFFGATTAQSLLQSGHEKIARLTLSAGVYWLVIIAMLTSDEYAHIGTYAEYHSGMALSIFATPSFMKELNIMGAILALPAIAVAVFLFKRSKTFQKGSSFS